MENRLTYLQDFFLLQPLEETALIDETIFARFRESSASMDGGSSFFWLINYLKREPEYVSESVKQVLGYHRTVINNSSMASFMRLVPEEDRFFLMKVYADIHDYFQKIPTGEKGLYRFDFNYRVQRADKRFVSVVQQIMFLQSSRNGYPLIELSLITDFSTYKSNPQIQLQVYKLEEGEYKKVNSFQYDECFEKLTEREKEVIDLIAAGLTDKEIADKICVSLHTVKTHRKRIVQKTNSRNTVEAVNKYLTITSSQV